MNGNVTISIEDYENLLAAQKIADIKSEGLFKQINEKQKEIEKLEKEQDYLVNNIEDKNNFLIVKKGFVIYETYTLNTVINRIVLSEIANETLLKVAGQIIEEANKQITASKCFFKKVKLLDIKDFKSFVLH